MPFVSPRMSLSHLKFEPGYTSPPHKTQLIDTIRTIRVSLEDSRTLADQENEEEILETAADECATCCRSVALVITAMLLIRHVYVVLTVSVGGYPFSLITVIKCMSCSWTLN